MTEAEEKTPSPTDYIAEVYIIYLRMTGPKSGRYTPVILAMQKAEKQEHHEFEASLSYTVKLGKKKKSREHWAQSLPESKWDIARLFQECITWTPKALNYRPISQVHRD